MKDFIKEIDEDISDIFSRDFVITSVHGDRVPSDEDQDITFDYGTIKKGKEFQTCVLHVDIRNSTQLNLKYNTNKLGMLYSAFVKSAIRSIEYYKGKVRTINGDRVMGVFPSLDCFNNSISAAITINHITNNVLSKYFKEEPIKCGVGVDHGTMRVFKTGVRRGNDRNASKSLVWLGRPANVASKLADLSNKPYHYFNVTFLTTSLLSQLLGNTSGNPSTYETVGKIPESDFTANISMQRDKSPLYKGKTVKEFVRKQDNMPAILFTEEVYNGLLKENLGKNLNANNQIEQTPITVKGFPGKIVGTNVIWKI